MRYILFCVFLWICFLLIWCDQNYNKIDNSTGVVYDIKDLESQIIWKQDASYENNYQQDASIENLRLLIDYLWSDFQYDKAASYFQDLMKRTNERDRKKLLQITINDIYPNPWHYEKLSSFLDQYSKEWKLNNDDYIFFDFTIKLLNWVFNKTDINTLTGNYVEFKNSLRKQFDLFYSYKDAPEYYRTALFAVAYFKHWDLGVAKYLANKALESNSQYILPYQIKTYVWVLTRDFTWSKQNLDILLQLDPSSTEWYQFLLWITYFSNAQYSQSKNYFIQMKSPNLTKESLRYLTFIERNLKSKNQSKGIDNYDKLIVGYMERLFEMDGLKPIDFQSFYDRYFYDRIVVWSWWLTSAKELYAVYPDLLNSALAKCLSTLTDELYVCSYGEWIMELLKWNHETALRKLIPLVKKYPQRQLYYLIWLLYKEQWLLENAKVYFGKTLQFIDVWQRNKVSDIMLELLNKQV